MRKLLLKYWPAMLLALLLTTAAPAQTLLKPPTPAKPAPAAPAAQAPAPAPAAQAPAAPAAAPNVPAPSATASDAETETPTTVGSDLSFLKLLTRGGWAMWPLALCSLVGLALIIERGLALRRKEILPPSFMDGLRKLYRSRDDTEVALAYCHKNPSSIGRIMSAAIRKLPEGTAVTEQAIADQGATEIARLRRNLRMLHGIAAITPTLGLLGTVTGMIRAFEVASSVGLGHSERLMQGIYEALVATMTGLLIAVPVHFFYYLYLGIIDRTILDLNDSCQAFLERLDRGPSALEREAVSEQPTETTDKIM